MIQLSRTLSLLFHVCPTNEFDAKNVSVRVRLTPRFPKKLQSVLSVELDSVVNDRMFEIIFLHYLGCDTINCILDPGFLSVDENRLPEPKRILAYLVHPGMYPRTFRLALSIKLLFRAHTFERAKRGDPGDFED